VKKVCFLPKSFLKIADFIKENLEIFITIQKMGVQIGEGI